MELGLWISILSRILDSMSCIPDSTSKNFTDCGIWTPLHGAITWISYSWLVKLGSSPFCLWLKKKIMQTWWVERGSLKCYTGCWYRWLHGLVWVSFFNEFRVSPNSITTFRRNLRRPRMIWALCNVAWYWYCLKKDFSPYFSFNFRCMSAVVYHSDCM